MSSSSFRRRSSLPSLVSRGGPQVAVDAAAIVQAIDDAYDKEARGEARAYLGASIVGNPCDAYLALSMRGFPENKIDARLKRIFALGHHLESVVVKDLRRAGLNVLEVDGFTGRQFAHESHGGHVRSHMDGQVIDGDRVLGLEIKSMNAKKFADYKVNGVRQSHPAYFLQMQMMSLMGGYPQFVFVAYCKDTSEYHVQIVDRDEFEGWAIEARIERVMENKAERVAKDEADWRCRGCFKSAGCWHGAEVAKACRTCAHSKPNPKGGWWCLKNDSAATQPCDEWERYTPRNKT